MVTLCGLSRVVGPVVKDMRPWVRPKLVCVSGYPKVHSVQNLGQKHGETKIEVPDMVTCSSPLFNLTLLLTLSFTMSLSLSPLYFVPIATADTFVSSG